MEPGVTQGQLYDFLREQKSRLWMDATGSTREASVVGNAVERGFGHTPYGDRFSHICGLELILPTGECVDTGFARFPGAKAAPLHRWGLGPSVDGLFSQSNFGVVTRMTLWLMPAPEYFQAFFLRCDTDDALGPLIDALRPLRLNGTLRSAVHIGNDYKVLSGLQQYPWEETGGKTPLGLDQMRAFRRKLNFGAWNASGGLYGTRAQVAASRRIIRRALAGKVSRLQFIDDRTLRIAERFATPFRLLTGWDLSRTLGLLRPVYGLMKGIPTDKPLASAYWRKPRPVPQNMDPDRDRCGLLWYAPVAPAEASCAEALTTTAVNTILEHGFEPMISLTTVSERSLMCVISLSYDRDVDGEDDRALACYHRLRQQLAGQGYYSYRLGTQSMSEMDPASGYNELLRKLKKTLDPNDILAPRRYHPGIDGSRREQRSDDEELAFPEPVPAAQ
jgi:4-cresol dehydrogenase (hydroxylating)